MDKKEFTYEINGKTYIQRPLVLGQIGQITEVLKGIEITQGMGIEQIVQLLGDRLPAAMAVVLTEKGKKVRDKNLPALTEAMQDDMDVGTAIEVMDHFLSLNPIASAFGKLTGIMAGITKAATGSRTSSSQSPEETSRSGTTSSGDTHSESASLT